MQRKSSPKLIRTYRVAKTIHAPLPFTFGWCTDFREDDPEITGSKSRHTILEKTKDKVVFTVEDRAGDRIRKSTETVTLKPPDEWHLDAVGEGKEEDEIGDYRLSRIGKNRTKLDMVFKVKYKDPSNIPKNVEWEKDTSEFWDKLVVALERDYDNSGNKTINVVA